MFLLFLLNVLLAVQLSDTWKEIYKNTVHTHYYCFDGNQERDGNPRPRYLRPTCANPFTEKLVSRLPTSIAFSQHYHWFDAHVISALSKLGIQHNQNLTELPLNFYLELLDLRLSAEKGNTKGMTWDELASLFFFFDIESMSVGMSLTNAYRNSFIHLARLLIPKASGALLFKLDRVNSNELAKLHEFSNNSLGSFEIAIISDEQNESYILFAEPAAFEKMMLIHSLVPRLKKNPFQYRKFKAAMREISRRGIANYFSPPGYIDYFGSVAVYSHMLNLINMNLLKIHDDVKLVLYWLHEVEHARFHKFKKDYKQWLKTNGYIEPVEIEERGYWELLDEFNAYRINAPMASERASLILNHLGKNYQSVVGSQRSMSDFMNHWKDSLSNEELSVAIIIRQAIIRYNTMSNQELILMPTKHKGIINGEEISQINFLKLLFHRMSFNMENARKYGDNVPNFKYISGLELCDALLVMYNLPMQENFMQEFVSLFIHHFLLENNHAPSQRVVAQVDMNELQCKKAVLNAFTYATLHDNAEFRALLMERNDLLYELSIDSDKEISSKAKELLDR